MQISKLIADEKNALSGGDPAAVRGARRALAQTYPGEPQGAEAAYRLAIDFLFKDKALDEAMLWLRIAAKSKVWPWAVSARLSLGLVLRAQGKVQQAAFEFRKVIASDHVSILIGQAWGMLVMLLAEQDRKDELDRAREGQIAYLEKLGKEGPEEDAALAYFQLGMEHHALGRNAKAAEALKHALANKALPHRERELAEATLKICVR